jgi:hypothetical protein
VEQLNRKKKSSISLHGAGTNQKEYSNRGTAGLKSRHSTDGLSHYSRQHYHDRETMPSVNMDNYQWNKVTIAKIERDKSSFAREVSKSSTSADISSIRNGRHSQIPSVPSDLSRTCRPSNMISYPTDTAEFDEDDYHLINVMPGGSCSHGGDTDDLAGTSHSNSLPSSSHHSRSAKKASTCQPRRFSLIPSSSTLLLQMI